MSKQKHYLFSTNVIYLLSIPGKKDTAENIQENCKAADKSWTMQLLYFHSDSEKEKAEKEWNMHQGL